MFVFLIKIFVIMNDFQTFPHMNILTISYKYCIISRCLYKVFDRKVCDNPNDLPIL